MLDRASTFADSEIVEMLKTRFVPVAIDQANQRRQKDTEGDFYRKIASQGPRNNFRSTTQGFYVATPSGKLLLFNNNRHPEKVRRLLKEQLAEYDLLRSSESSAKPMARETTDARYSFSAPDGGLVVRVRTKVLGGYEPTDDRWRQIFQSALSRDNLWVSKAEHESLSRGDFPPGLAQRVARFHLVDNTRGEPPMWKAGEVRDLKLNIRDGRVSGVAHVETKDGRRGYKADLRGRIEIVEGKVVRFDLVALGDFWGEGRYTRRAPKGKFPLAVSFELADGTDVADALQPQGSRGWVDGYLH